jgi:SPP1 family predicted phage head-tail adaptor
MSAIGRLLHRVEIEEPLRTPDGYGGYTETWQNIATTWAKVEPASAKERYFADKIEHNVTHVITIRSLGLLDTSMRVVFRDRVFHIRGIRDELERRRWMMLNCEEGVGT